MVFRQPASPSPFLDSASYWPIELIRFSKRQGQRRFTGTREKEPRHVWYHGDLRTHHYPRHCPYHFWGGKVPTNRGRSGQSAQRVQERSQRYSPVGCGTARSESTGIHARPIHGPGCTANYTRTDSRRSEAHGTVYAWAGTDPRDPRRLDPQHGGSATAGSAIDLHGSPV